MDGGVIFLAAAIIAILLCTIVVVLCFRYVQKTYNLVDDVLDRILAGNNSLCDETIKEDRISKLTHKASRIMDMYILEAAQTKEEKETIQGFISDMSHQMKTPLSSISMYADLLIEGNVTPAEQREFYSRIKSGTDSLQWMMDSLIKMSRLEVGAIQLLRTSLSIKQTISDSITSVLASALKKNIDIVVAEFEDIPLLHDKRWTQEAMVNILENAVKYLDNYGKIEIAVEPLPMYTKITITDCGMGIDKNEWHLIFKRFYRGNNSKSAGGAGLGLYLVSLIMEKQGGYVIVDSVIGEYFSISLFLQNN